MKTTIENITPKLAQQYLDKVKSGHQRKLINSRAEAFAREMTAKHWFTHHQGIAFDEHGNLIDGQHRLKAIIISGINVTMLVTRGVQAEMVNGVRLFAIDTMDNGYKRQTGEQLALRHGIENSNRVTAAAAAILYWATNLSRNTTPVSLEIIALYPSLKKLSQGKSKVLPGCIVGAFAIATKTFPELLECFVDPYITGAGLSAKSPALLLRNYVLNSSIGSGAMRGRLINAALNALKAEAFKEKIKTLRSHDSGSLFFKDQQKTNVKKIRAAAGLTENQEEANHE